MRAQMAAQTEALNALMGQLIPAASTEYLTREVTTNVSAPLSSDETGQQSEKTPHTASRRSLLKWGGLGAAAALTAAGGAALTSQTAQAANGNYMVLGSTGNTAESNTKITVDSTTSNLYGLISNAENSPDSVGVWAIAGDGGIGVKATVTGASGTAIYGISGSGNTGTGVCGQSDSGWGVYAYSLSGVALAAAGTGRIFQTLSGFTGAPTSGYNFKGEQIRDSKGDLYLCIAEGTPGTWRKVAAGIPGVSGAINFLANPIRLLDTRTSFPYVAGSTHALQVTGVSIGGISVPIGAVGVVGNVTVVRASASGDLRLYPGSTAPDTSSINFAAGQIVANGVTVGLNGSGQLNIKVDMPTGANVNVLFDASGYVL